jgi:beta-1,4-N-acetylglucosaminyltransferase
MGMVLNMHLAIMLIKILTYWIMEKKILLVSSDGGHLAQLLSLQPMFEKYDYLIVTEKSPATLPLADKFNIQFLRPRPRDNKKNLSFFYVMMINIFKTLKILLKHKPKYIISTGSLVALPSCYLGKILGARVVWILTFARITSKETSANLAYPISDLFIVQWPEMVKYYKKSVYLGSIY